MNTRIVGGLVGGVVGVVLIAVLLTQGRSEGNDVTIDTAQVTLRATKNVAPAEPAATSGPRATRDSTPTPVATEIENAPGAEAVAAVATLPPKEDDSPTPIGDSLTEQRSNNPPVNTAVDEAELQVAATFGPDTAPEVLYKFMPGNLNYETNDPDYEAVRSALQSYADAVNNGDYRKAHTARTARLRGSGEENFAKFADAMRSTRMSRIGLRGLAGSGSIRHAYAAFVSTQDPELGPDGQRCTIWLIDYTMVNTDGAWQIDGSKRLGESPLPCPNGG